MAGSEGQEKTEAATPRRQSEAASEGQVPYSKEVVEAMLFLGIIGGLAIFGEAMVQALSEILRRHFRFENQSAIAPEGIVGFLRREASIVAELILPIFGAVAVIVILVGAGQVGFKLAPKKLSPKPSKLDPIKGLKKILSIRSLMTVLLQSTKLLVVGIVTGVVIAGLFPLATRLAQKDPLTLVWLFPDAIFEIGISVGIILLFLAILDLAFQRWKHSQDIKMSKQEVKDDQKNTDGDPQIKGRIRQLQRERARARMLGDVKRATVVVRNPTHYAIALRYEAGQDAAPIVLAKGKNILALRIIELAEQADVPIRSDPPLARRMYPLVKVGQIVPEELFRAVAQVLAWVYRRQGRDQKALRSANETLNSPRAKSARQESNS